MPTDETENWYRDRKKSPKSCEESTYRTTNPKKGVQIVLCKDKKCVKKRGMARCPMEVQSIRHDKSVYEKVEEGVYKLKEK